MPLQDNFKGLTMNNFDSFKRKSCFMMYLDVSIKLD